jgi:hypothetical protein
MSVFRGIDLTNDTQPRTFVLDAWVWIFCLVALAYLNSGLFQIFPIPGWVDAGMYLGYALNLPDLVDRFGFAGLTYHGSRLSYVLPRFLLRQLLDPTAAQYVEVNLLYLASLLSVFGIGWHLCGRPAAFLAAAFLAFNPSFISSLTFGGSEGAAICYQLLSAAFLFSPAGLSRKPVAICAAGFMCGLALASHLFSVIPLSGIGLAHVVASSLPTRRLVAYGWLAVGAALSLAVCGAIGTLFGLDFFFLGYSLAAVGQSVKGIGSEYRLPLFAWLFGAYRVLVPSALIVCFALLANRFKANGSRFWAIGLVALLPLAFYVVWDSAIGGVLIQTRSYFALMLPCVLLSLLALSHQISDQTVLSRRTMAITWIVLASPSLAVSMAPGVFEAMEIAAVQQSLFVTVAAGLTLLALAARNAVRQNRQKSMPAIWLATLFVASTCVALDLDSMPVYRAATGLNYRHGYDAAVRLVEWIEASGIGARQPVFWFNRAELTDRLGTRSTYRLKFQNRVLNLNYFDSLAALYLWNESLLSGDLPLVDHSVLKKNPPPDTVVVLSRDTSTVMQGERRLRALGYIPTPLGSLEYDSEDFAWRAAAFGITRRPEPPEEARKATSLEGVEVAALSVTPSVGSGGGSQTFALTYRDSRGAEQLSTEWVWWNQAFVGGAHSCMAYHERATDTVYLLDDTGTSWLSGVVGNGTLQNSQCAIDLKSSFTASSGTTLTLNLAITFTPEFAGLKNVYMFANAAGRLTSGWHDRGDWHVDTGPRSGKASESRRFRFPRLGRSR